MQEPVVSIDRHSRTGVALTAARQPLRPTVSRWLRWVTYASVLAPLPSAVWRLGLAAGLPMGFSAERLHGLDVPGWGSPDACRTVAHRRGDAPDRVGHRRQHPGAYG